MLTVSAGVLQGVIWSPLLNKHLFAFWCLVFLLSLDTLMHDDHPF